MVLELYPKIIIFLCKTYTKFLYLGVTKLVVKLILIPNSFHLLYSAVSQIIFLSISSTITFVQVSNPLIVFLLFILCLRNDLFSSQFPKLCVSNMSAALFIFLCHLIFCVLYNCLSCCVNPRVKNGSSSILGVDITDLLGI